MSLRRTVTPGWSTPPPGFPRWAWWTLFLATLTFVVPLTSPWWSTLLRGEIQGAEDESEVEAPPSPSGATPEPVVPGSIDAWIAALGWEPLVNRKGTTWRQLDEALRASVVDSASARRVMLANPSVVKRPVVEWGDASVSVGFDPDAWARR